MKVCGYCQAKILASAKFCEQCGAVQTPTEHPPVHTHRVNANTGNDKIGLVVLCIITFAGSAFGMFRAWFYQSFAYAFDNDEYWRGIAFLFCHLGTIAGAILILSRKYMGLYVYTLFQAAYLLLTLYTASVYTDHDTGFLPLMISMIFFVPGLIMLILFWMPFSRNNIEQH